MSRSLSRTVVAGGVVYPAGTAATPELEAQVTNPGHWSGGATAAAKAEPQGEAPARVRTSKRASKKSESGEG